MDEYNQKYYLTLANPKKLINFTRPYQSQKYAGVVSLGQGLSSQAFTSWETCPRITNHLSCSRNTLSQYKKKISGTKVRRHTTK